MLAAWCSAAVTIEAGIGIQIVAFEISIDTFAARTCGPTSRGGLDHH
jgi:hypothetical protein